MWIAGLIMWLLRRQLNFQPIRKLETMRIYLNGSKGKKKYTFFLPFGYQFDSHKSYLKCPPNGRKSFPHVSILIFTAQLGKWAPIFDTLYCTVTCILWLSSTQLPPQQSLTSRAGQKEISVQNRTSLCSCHPILSKELICVLRVAIFFSLFFFSLRDLLIANANIMARWWRGGDDFFCT